MPFSSRLSDGVNQEAASCEAIQSQGGQGPEAGEVTPHVTVLPA